MLVNIQIMFFWVMASHSLEYTNVLQESQRLYMISREIWVMEVRKGQSEPATRKQRSSDRPTGTVLPEAQQLQNKESEEVTKKIEKAISRAISKRLC
jgi:hypothetical protein